MKKLFYLLALGLFLSTASTSMAQDVYGCMDQSALNYNPLATIDNGSCMYYCDSTVTYFYYTSIDDSLITVYKYASSIGGPIDYLWDFGDGSTSNEEYPNHFYNESGVYTLCLTITAPGQDSNSVCTATYCDSVVVNEWISLSVTNNSNVYGCTDPAALNYNPLATVNDGSCIYPQDSTDVYGCMDPMALNYNPLATIDDGSCFYANDTTDVYGCMDPMALNYNPLATIDDGSCIYFNDSTAVFGCMDTSALNYNPLATIDDGSCFYYCDSTQAYFYIYSIDEDLGIVTVVNSSVSLDPIISYLWDFGDGTTSTEAYPSHEYASTGVYTLCLSISAATPSGNMICSSTYCDSLDISLSIPGFVMSGFTLNVISGITTGIKEKEMMEYSLYPNPAREQLSIKYTLTEQELINTSIYDLSGRVLMSNSENIPAGLHVETIDISSLPAGMYQVELRNNDTRNVKRFQVIK